MAKGARIEPGRNEQVEREPIEEQVGQKDDRQGMRTVSRHEGRLLLAPELDGAKLDQTTPAQRVRSVQLDGPGHDGRSPDDPKDRPLLRPGPEGEKDQTNRYQQAAQERQGMQAPGRAAASVTPLSASFHCPRLTQTACFFGRSGRALGILAISCLAIALRLLASLLLTKRTPEL